MNPYSNFQLSSDDIAKVNDRHYRRALAEYIRTHGTQPDDETALSFMTATAAELEEERRILYALRTQKPQPHDYSLDYFTIKALENGTIQWNISGNTIEYSKNDGQWINWNGSTALSVLSGDVFRFRGNNNTYTGTMMSPTINATFSFNVYGNIMSLIGSSSFSNLTTISTSKCFNYFLGSMFGTYTRVVDASKLILPATTLASECYDGMFAKCSSLTASPKLPATTLADSCYHNMFNSCTSLETAPELLATTLVNSCYSQMFLGCTSLNYIKCLATDISASICTSNWVRNVAATGTFVKNSSMTGWTTGDNGIPSGWTVQDAS